MTSAATRQVSGTGGRIQGGGLILFAAVMLVIIGCFNLIYGIAAIANSFIPAYPFWALVILAADVVALYGLCAYGSRANLAA